jgi:hypothetical protein
MPLWTLKSFTSPGGDTIVGEWFAEQAEEVQAAFIARMKFLRALPADGWDRPYVGQLRRGECKGLFEIVLKVNKVQYRPIGYFSGRGEFTFLAFATERDGKFDPIDVCATAKKRLEVISQNKERVRELKIYG